MIKITDAARDKINEVLGKNPGKYVRVIIRGGG
jgi:Fe-S cluster assembly iron-binding protein IscA